MIKKETIEKIVSQHLEGTDLFPVTLKVTERNDITIIIDGDSGVKVSDCIALNRYVEQQLDRDHEDFSVEVSSYGIGNPLLLPRQYIKNTGRLLEVNLSGGRVETGRIISADEKGVVIGAEQGDKRDKGKRNDPVFIHLSYEDIDRSVIKVEF